MSMSGEHIQVEQLSSGLRAAFITMPHFRTTSARLTINSGSLHEAQETAGAAHFLEHITFQGTEDLPTWQEVDRYLEEKLVSANVFTNQTDIKYVVNGYDLESAGYFITQAALFPTLTPEALEKERKPIVNELLEYASSPYYLANIEHARTLGGVRYARPMVAQ